MNRSTLTGLNREPNVVPMIDVLLVLLIIFMMATAYQRLALDLQLPQEVVGGGPGAPIVLEVRPGPTYALNGQELPVSQLSARIVAVYRDRPDKLLFVRGDPAVRAAVSACAKASQRWLVVMAALRERGRRAGP